VTKKFCARAPVRISFLGGGTDCPPYSTEFGGAVINAAISRYAYATVRTGERGVKIISNDYNALVESPDVEALTFDGKLDLLKASIKRCNIQTGFTLITESNVPVGSGLGASGALSVAVLAAMHKAFNKPVNPKELAHLSFVVERQDLGYPGGSQDQYGAAFGGINYLTFKDSDIEIEQLAGYYSQSQQLTHQTLMKLEKNLLLIYTGKSHISNNIHNEIRTSYLKEGSSVKHAMHELKRLADKGREVLLRGDLHTFAELLNDNWKWHKELHPSCNDETLENAYSIALNNGAIGGETCGAGAGGCIVFLCEDEMKPNVSRLLKAAGYEIIDFIFDFSGVQVWEA